MDLINRTNFIGGKVKRILGKSVHNDFFNCEYYLLYTLQTYKKIYTHTRKIVFLTYSTLLKTDINLLQ